MSTDKIGNVSTEQLLAMSLMNNGQVTNNSNSGTNDQMNYAFQLMLQDYLKSSTENSSKNSQDVKNVGSDSKNNNEVNEKIIQAANSNAALKEIQQNYQAGTSLLDIPLEIDGSINVNSLKNSNINNISRSTNSADLNKIYSEVSKASKKYGVNANLILAIIKQESDFNPNVVSSAGAVGLMQLMPENISDLGVNNGYDVSENIDAGTRHIKEYLNMFGGNTEMALMAYNAGPGTMQRRGVSSLSDLYKMPLETQNYVPKVMNYYQNNIKS